MRASERAKDRISMGLETEEKKKNRGNHSGGVLHLKRSIFVC